MPEIASLSFRQGYRTHGALVATKPTLLQAEERVEQWAEESGKRIWPGSIRVIEFHDKYKITCLAMNDE